MDRAGSFLEDKDRVHHSPVPYLPCRQGAFHLVAYECRTDLQIPVVGSHRQVLVAEVEDLSMDRLMGGAEQVLDSEGHHGVDRMLVDHEWDLVDVARFGPVMRRWLRWSKHPRTLPSAAPAPASE